MTARMTRIQDLTCYQSQKQIDYCDLDFQDFSPKRCLKIGSSSSLFDIPPHTCHLFEPIYFYISLLNCLSFKTITFDAGMG
jgi:hypothetical protein